MWSGVAERVHCSNCCGTSHKFSFKDQGCFSVNKSYQILCNPLNCKDEGRSHFLGMSPAKVVLFEYDCANHNKLWEIIKEMGILEHLSCLPRNLYAGQEAIVRTRHGTTDWFQIGKGVCQGCILSHCLFNLYAEYIVWNAGLDEAQAGIKIAKRNINNLRYEDDTTLMAECEKELKSLLMRVKEESDKASLKLNIKRNKIMASGPITSWQT